MLRHVTEGGSGTTTMGRGMERDVGVKVGLGRAGGGVGGCRLSGIAGGKEGRYAVGGGQCGFQAPASAHHELMKKF